MFYKTRNFATSLGMNLDPVYEYVDYWKFLNDQIEKHSAIRGYKGLLAEAAGCQRSFLSQVLSGQVQLTPDHAIGLASFWKMDPDATEYFMDLVNLGRAATPSLKSHLEKKLKERRTRMRDAAVRINKPELANIEQQSVYYSNWYWMAVHMLVGLKGYNSEGDVARRLHLPVEMVRQALPILQNMGLVEKEKGQWKATTKSLHAPRDSIFSWLHHDSWRARSSEDIRKRKPDSVHFTGIFTLSEADKAKIQDLVLKLMDNAIKIVEPSPEEDMACLCIDWFDV